MVLYRCEEQNGHFPEGKIYNIQQRIHRVSCILGLGQNGLLTVGENTKKCVKHYKSLPYNIKIHKY